MLATLWANASPFTAFFPETSLNLVFEAEGGEQFELIDVLPDPTVYIEAETISADLATRLHCFLATLSERDRLIIHNHFWLEQRQEDIGAVLGITQSAVAGVVWPRTERTACMASVVRWKDGMTTEMSAGFAKWQRQVAL